MILKELYIVSLKNKEVIKKYSFNEFGVNVILGVAKKDSNGVGKTAMIDSLRMVLGEKLPVDFKNKEELIKRDIMLVLKIQTEKKIEYLARQIIDEENGYVSDYLSMDIKGWDSYEIDDYRKYVQALVFEKLNGEDIPSLQAIREYLMRDEKIGFGDISLTRRNAVQNSRCLNFLSLIPVNYEVEINKLKKEQVELENEIKIIKTIAKDITRLKAEKIKLESEIVKIEKMLDSIDVCEKIDYDEEKYISAKKRLKDSNYNIPVLVLLGVMTKATYTIKQYICDKLDIGVDICESLLEEGKINLFLDGLNEIPADAGGNLKTLRMREIKQLLRDYPKTFIIITNRPQDTRDFNNVPIFNLIKLSKEEMRDFIKKNVDEEDVKELLFTSINGNERFVQIINTPLILSRLIEIVRYKKEIPHSEGEIIAEFLNCLLVREKEEKQDARLDIKRIIYLLRMIAFESLEKKEANSGMTESEVLKYCSKSMDTYRFQYDALYALDIVLQLGILEKREDLYVFSHQAYQDYYYAMEELAVIQS